MLVLGVWIWKLWKNSKRDKELEDMMAPSTRADPYADRDLDDVPGSSVRYSEDDESPTMREI